MSESLKNLVESIELTAKLRRNAAGIEYAWKKLNRVESYLQKQVNEHFAQ